MELRILLALNFFGGSPKEKREGRVKPQWNEDEVSRSYITIGEEMPVHVKEYSSVELSIFSPPRFARPGHQLLSGPLEAPPLPLPSLLSSALLCSALLSSRACGGDAVGYFDFRAGYWSSSLACASGLARGRGKTGGFSGNGKSKDPFRAKRRRRRIECLLSIFFCTTYGMSISLRMGEGRDFFLYGLLFLNISRAAEEKKVHILAHLPDVPTYTITLKKVSGSPERQTRHIAVKFTDREKEKTSWCVCLEKRGGEGFFLSEKSFKKGEKNLPP